MANGDGVAKPWSRQECELTVAAYLQLLEREMRGERVNKAELYRQLAPQLDDRSSKSVEYKFQNISAVLQRQDCRFISGLKPLHNVQALLGEVVVDHLNAKQQHIQQWIARSLEVLPIRDASDFSRFVVEPPPLEVREASASYRAYHPVKFDFARQEAANRKLGQRGEKLVFDYEKYRLIRANRPDLAREVEWTSMERGDGAGYDIRSFDPARDEERFIEVKATTAGKFQPFLLTDNELAFSKARASQFSLYRVFDFVSSPRLFMLQGDLSGQLNLKPKVYRAGFG